MPDFVQGFLATLTLDGNDISLVVADFAFPRTRTALDKSSMDGTGVSKSIPGLETGALNISGHVDQANLNLLEVSWAKDVAVAFTFTIDEGLTTDASYSGTVALTGFDVTTAADSNWAFTLSGDTSGVTTFTPSSP